VKLGANRTDDLFNAINSSLRQSTNCFARLLLRDERLSQRPARWPECPGSECETEEKQWRDQVGGTTAYRKRSNCARQFKNNTGISPFLKPEKAWNPKSDRSEDLPNTKDAQDVRWISQTGQNM